jgi:hypothetical protein
MPSASHWADDRERPYLGDLKRELAQKEIVFSRSGLEQSTLAEPSARLQRSAAVPR